MYKLDNGQLIVPPKVWKGVINYDKDLNRLVKDGWKPLITEGLGDLYKYIERKDCIVKSFYSKPYDYKEERQKAYESSGLSLGNVLDAVLKAYDGDDSELKTIITQRQIIKKNIKKI